VGQDIGAEMVRQGWALDYERFSDGRYAAQQLEAEQTERGLWSGSFIPPWEWRAR
jgi:endonuclease YncB( thermonuclease family)